MKEFTLGKSLTNVNSVASVLVNHSTLRVMRKSTVENTGINAIVMNFFLKVCLARVRGQ